MFCSQCGHNVGSTAKFCSSCGTALSPSVSPSVSASAPCVSIGSDPDELPWESEFDISVWVGNTATSNHKSPEEWGSVILGIYRRVFENTPRWDEFTEAFESDPAGVFGLITLEDCSRLELAEILALTVAEASLAPEKDPEPRLTEIERWLDARDWSRVPGVSERDRGRLHFVRGYMYSINGVADEDRFAKSLAESLDLGFGPAAIPFVEEYMFTRSDLGNAVTTLIQGKERGSAACALWLADLEDSPGAYSGIVSDDDGNEEMAFVSFNPGGFGTMPTN